MKKGMVLLSALVTMLVFTVNGQQVNGQKVNFPKGKENWSDTIFKKLMTAEMKKDGQKAVLLGIRLKIVNESSAGKWYNMEITNKSVDQKVKFDIANHKTVLTVKLKPQQTKIVELLNWKIQKTDSGVDDYYWEYPGMEFIKE